MKINLGFVRRAIKLRAKAFYGIFMGSIPLALVALFVILYFFNGERSLNFIKNFYNEKIEKILIKNAGFCDKIEITGVNNLNAENFQKKIDKFCEAKTFDIKKLREDIMDDVWIRDAHIKKILPNRLKIEIAERHPFAIFSDEKEQTLVDQFGDKINIEASELYKFRNLLRVSGAGYEKEINSFFNLLSTRADALKDLYKIERIGERRWNLILKNGVVVKLPEEDEDIFETWSALEKLLNVYGLSVGLKNIDLRARGKIYLQYRDPLL
ncbi:MAG: FtsQ-type POTRA domain-containing protein [Rickettsiales bacterium]|jgi:cell division septal protein FtsQ|nr:FtsQ-type POTRA domain-containing protein [Rickettsiales bacterium]